MALLKEWYFGVIDSEKNLSVKAYTFLMIHMPVTGLAPFNPSTMLYRIRYKYYIASIFSVCFKYIVLTFAIDGVHILFDLKNWSLFGDLNKMRTKRRSSFLHLAPEYSVSIELYAPFAIFGLCNYRTYFISPNMNIHLHFPSCIDIKLILLKLFVLSD